MARKLLALRLLAIATAETWSSYDNGQEFTKCISITDFQNKTLDDNITLIDRVNSCCPAGSTAGAAWENLYRGAQVVCGFKSDGKVSVSSSTSGGGTKTCTYHKCYVDKQNLDCPGGKKQLLNGCCPDTTKANEGFLAHCKNWFKSVTTVNSASNERINYCTTYHKDYVKRGWEGTAAKTDDQSGGKLIPSKIRTYAPCDGEEGHEGVIFIDPRKDWKLKNKVTLFCLTYFLGMCGCDRCYMGSIAMGVAKGLTVGGCGVWTIIDFFVVLINGLGKEKFIDSMGFKAVFEKDTVDSAATACVVLILMFPACCLFGACLQIIANSRQK